MLLGGRTTSRTFRHIIFTSSQVKAVFIHHGTPMRFMCPSKSLEQQHLRSEGGPILDTKPREHPITSYPETAPGRLIEFLNLPLDAQASRSPNNSSHERYSPIIEDVVSAYLAVRDSSSLVGQLHTSAYLLISERAEQSGLQQVMDLLAVDLLAHFPRDSDPDGFSKAVGAILSNATLKCPLTHERMLELYQALTVSNAVKASSLDSETLHRIMKATIARPDACTPPLESLAPALLLSDDQRPNAKSTWTTYELLMKILLAGEESHPHALAVFQQLIQAGRVPKHAQDRAEQQAGSFKIVIVTALVQGCLEFSWHERAALIMLEILREPQWHRAEGITEEDVKATAGLGLEVLQALVHSPTISEVRMARRLIRALLPMASDRHLTSLGLPPPVEIPHDILSSFYDACYNRRVPDAAASVWLHLQSPNIRRFHEYPPPRHSALWWLFDYFASPGVSPAAQGQRPQMFRGSVQFARTLLGEVLRQGHPIPVMDRPRFIALAAARGYGLYARQLWELYTADSDPDRDVVRGNAQMLVRLVSLFRKSQMLWDEAIEAKRSAAPLEGDKSNGADLVPSTTAIGQEGTRATSPEVEDSLPRDYWRFAERVLASYIETKQPLAMASQQDLNALARAHLLLGHTVEGIEALTVIMARGDTPDLKDINVALTGLASYSPRRAAQMIERMLKRGVEPTASTFGAVLHEALQDKDSELVEQLVARARELGHGALTQKAVATLLRSTISFEFTTDKEERIKQQWAVRGALQAVETIMRYPSSQTGRKDHGKDHALSVNMGEDCVKAALNAMQPVMAFQFWKLLLKNRVRRDDREATSARAWIARLIRYEWRQQHIGHDKAHEMLEELGAPGVEADGPRVSKPSTAIVDISLHEYNMRHR